MYREWAVHCSLYLRPKDLKFKALGSVRLS